MTDMRQTSECADCGESLDDDSDVLAVRTPCRVCASTRRIHNLSIIESPIVRDAIGLKAKHAGKKTICRGLFDT
jgi:hypothetical protein